MARVVEWFTRREAVRAAKHARVPVLAVELERAHTALAAADRVLEAATSTGVSVAPAVSLLSQAAYWALAAISEERKPSIGEQWSAVDPALIAGAAGGAEPLSELRDLLVGRTFVEVAELPEPALAKLVSRSRAFVQSLLDLGERRDEPLRRLYFQRLIRLGVTALLTVLFVTFALNRALLAARGPDLAAGKPWRASSALADCPLGATRQCAGQTVNIFFHTKHEATPWVEIDLEQPTTFSKVLIENREDCCEDRATPLVVEVSDDGAEFREVGRRNRVFSDLMLKFPETTARFVRLRVDKTTPMHLNRVSVFR
jgi:hypothetical protein